MSGIRATACGGLYVRVAKHKNSTHSLTPTRTRAPIRTRALVGARQKCQKSQREFSTRTQTYLLLRRFFTGVVFAAVVAGRRPGSCRPRQQQLSKARFQIAVVFGHLQSASSVACLSVSRAHKRRAAAIRAKHAPCRQVSTPSGYVPPSAVRLPI